MVNFSTLSSLFLSLFVSNSDVVTTNSQMAVNPIEINASSKIAAGVVIDDFSDEAKTYNWWDSSAEKWERKWDKEKEVYVVKCKGVGKKFECFGKQFDAIDFTATPVLKVKMKYEGATAPVVRIDLKDYDGKVANAKSLSRTLKAGDFDTYYFNMTDRWLQSWPENDKVDPVEIVELLIFVNPGAADFTGTLYLDSVEAVPVSECPKDK